MKRRLRMVIAVVAFGVASVFGSVALASPSSAQELDLCALLGGEYCPAGVSGGAQNADSLARTGTDLGAMTAVGAGLLAFGGAAAYAARRRSMAYSG